MVIHHATASVSFSVTGCSAMRSITCSACCIGPDASGCKPIPISAYKGAGQQWTYPVRGA